MEATVEHIDVGRGAGYYKICLKIGNYELTTTADWQHLQDLEEAKKIAETINKKIKEERDKSIAYAIELRRESHKYDPNYRG
jgi:hypothetical protein